MKSEQLLKLTIAYDGTDFFGWQRQKNTRTVQAILEQAFQKIVGRRIHLVGASRTDSGVHALGQVAHIKIQSKLSLPVLQRALNALLPEDVVIQSVRRVSPRFHARYSAQRKWYRYTIWNQPQRPLFDRDEALHVPVTLNLTAMRHAARLLQGRHDFKAFHSVGRPVSSTVRTLHLLDVAEKKGMILIDARADGFLYHMVRRIVGLLVEIGKGRYSPVVVKEIFEGKKTVIPPTAPAKGLCLMQVFYTS